eukprot:GFUD01030614.1.p1 GENE.GFUD01030614.1~~GFUD01030614.1.p1  ORF type:complete len:103 (-),score=9.77 GFUD01030614.1:226-534(-)
MVNSCHSTSVADDRPRHSMVNPTHPLLHLLYDKTVACLPDSLYTLDMAASMGPTQPASNTALSQLTMGPAFCSVLVPGCLVVTLRQLLLQRRRPKFLWVPES